MPNHSEYQRRYKAKPGIKEKYARLNREWIAKNRDRYNASKAAYRFRLKLSAIAHYSNGAMACCVCGFNSDLDALCLDHIANNGKAHRASLKINGRGSVGSTTVYERLKALGWMDGLQVLCANCNTIKEIRRKRGMTAEEMWRRIKAT